MGLSLQTGHTGTNKVIKFHCINSQRKSLQEEFILMVLQCKLKIPLLRGRLDLTFLEYAEYASTAI